eukprot:CAMPEP_0177576384 /NCGR_PEP_ID=MMETSP0369-20130122/80099_1 /TAXON_ID=447022 ORGANISM="Scrippsiella hangoei-like, Strain SHHI-4" /NCGR_SAMPLE_ID=MMETSP0369 /ASSEMBLY_ACC=CAM_ASM_000364 /LENGTH=350 /DNA_ID=CAMNT_0019064693 /DNA_START=1 /DNA_END=1050 /DNA_ORIENTATION=-
MLVQFFQDRDLRAVVAPFLQLPAKRALRAASPALLAASQALISGQHALLYLCGGNEPAGNCRSSVEIFDARTGQWTAAPSMSEGRLCAAGAALGGHVYICGGVQGSDNETASVERFDLARGIWERLPDMREARSGAAAAPLAGRLVVCGGMNPVRSSVEVFDPEVSMWQAGPSLNSARARPVAAEFDGRLFVCGGFENGPGGRRNLSSVEALEAGALMGWLGAAASSAHGERVAGAEEAAWAAAPSLSGPRFGAAAAVVGPRLFVCGGEGARSGYLRSAELLGRGAPCWETLPEMHEMRFGASAFAVAGRLYIGGGIGTSPLIECLDPETDTWAQTTATWTQRTSMMGVA